MFSLFKERNSKLMFLKNVAEFSDVVSVFECQARTLHTTRSWNFLGMEKHEGIPLNSIWNAARFGDDTIIANFDSGFFYSSPSNHSKFLKCIC